MIGIPSNRTSNSSKTSKPNANVLNTMNSTLNLAPLITVDTFYPMTTEQQLRTVFVSNIPELMEDATVNSIFRAIPGFDRFSRVLNGRGQALSYGFVRYSHVDSIKGLINTLSKIDFKSLTNNNFETLFSIYPEENTLRYIQDRLKENGEEYFDSLCVDSKGIPSATAIEKIIKDWYTQTSATYGTDITIKSQSFAHNEEGNNKENSNRNINDIKNLEDIEVDESEFADLEIDDRETVLREIREFRLLSLEYERVKQDQHAEEQKERDRHFEKLASKLLADDQGNKPFKNSYYSRYDDLDDSRLFTERDFGDLSASEDEDDTYDPETNNQTDEQIEEMRQSRIRLKQERAFEEEQRRLMARERMRTSALERERVRDAEYDARLERNKKQALKQFAEFVDNGEFERKNMEYYYNHATWVKNRMAFRRRELSHDMRDAEDERIELENKKNAEKFMSSLASELSQENAASESQPKFKISLGAAKKKQQQQQTAPVSDNDKDNSKEKEVTEIATTAGLSSQISVNYGAIKELDDLKDLYKEKQVEQPLYEKLCSLIDAIPKSSSNGLFDWNIHWDFITEDTIETRIEPFVTALIIEYLGIQEDELIGFVIDYIREHKPPQQLVSDLEDALDEDTIPFIEKVWRLVVFESERNFKKL